MKDYKDKEVLRELYWNKEYSLSDIGEKYNKSPATIMRWMEKNGIQRRTDSEGGSMKRQVNRASYFIDNEGYPSWCAWVSGENKQVRVHQLLAISCGHDPKEIFDGRGGSVVHHKNGCKVDNREGNIEVMGADEHINIHEPQR